MISRVYDLGQSGQGLAVLLEHAEDKGYSAVIRDHWSTDITSYDGNDVTVVYHDRGHTQDELIVADRQDEKWVGRLLIDGGESRTTVWAKTIKDAQAGTDELREQVPPMETKEGRCPVTFWVWAQYGPSSNVRRIEVPKWEDVADNYACREELDQLVDFQPASAGQLLLWRGEPGTGKTWALRALIWEWRDWADFHYVVDPDKFFGDHASYLTEVLFHGGDDNNLPTNPGSNGDEGQVKKDRWKVLILEDCGEMLSKDARERSGQGLSRLLNVVDGLIGQGLRVLVLVTTNEELGALHDAIRRPGRCAANIEFNSLSRSQAEAWLEEHHPETTLTPGGTYFTLAELYAMAEGRGATSKQLVGFQT